MAKSDKFIIKREDLNTIKSAMSSSVPAKKAVKEHWDTVEFEDGETATHTVGEARVVGDPITGGTARKPWKMHLVTDDEAEWLQAGETPYASGRTLLLYKGPAEVADIDHPEKWVYRWA